MTTTGFNLETNARTVFPWYNPMQVTSFPAATHLTTSSVAPIPGVTGAFCAGSNLAKISFVGDASGAENDQYEVKIYGAAPNLAETTWVSSFICEVRVTLGTAITNDTALFGNATYKWADAIELLSGDTSVRLVTDTANGIASITVDLEGATYLQGIGNEVGLTYAGSTWNGALALF